MTVWICLMTIQKISIVSMTKYLKKKRLKEEKFMAIEYLGLNELNGPLVVLEGV